ncbi:cytosine methyltransferase [Pontibacillus chungwhensis BH030062]|uniref:Cytosine-specific methyltransferase n=1 Tax=Pontibacillus chungwhensis BH030062 TaxID=1385513 RepID=A0A0A2UTL4_9BACI|nr:DNA cytosine methyltransferase [Pontibacillus chungwhensis]KGP91259.1 cytosine methyltransferase [Pontibacillus chungwhensis BH030062]
MDLQEQQFNFIDLFAGCGGFSEGFYQAGFRAMAHVEIDSHACETLKERMRYYNYSEEEIQASVLNEDMTNPEIPNKVANLVGEEEVDIVVGGPPCQSFSSLGRAKDPDSMKNDPRNYLFENYIDIINYFNPKIFVFENVKGILNAHVEDKRIIDTILDRMSENYQVTKDLKKIVLNSVNYGVPQTRERVIIIGVRKDLDVTPEEIYESIPYTHHDINGFPDENLTPYVTVGEAISDLPKLHPGEGKDQIEFYNSDLNRYTSELRNPDFGYLYNHHARGHNEEDMERYRLMSQNLWTLSELYENAPHLVHAKKRLFNNSYVVQRADKPGRTIIAHLYKDGNQFIHPDPAQARTFTVREAARIQSFPDDFKFMGSRTQQYKQVGNAVPPLMAKQIANTIKHYLIQIQETQDVRSKTHAF